MGAGRCLVAAGVTVHFVVARYRDGKLRKYLRADAAFAKPKVYEYLEREGFR